MLLAESTRLLSRVTRLSPYSKNERKKDEKERQNRFRKERTEVLLRSELEARILMIRMRAHACQWNGMFHGTNKRTLTCHILRQSQRLEESHAYRQADEQLSVES